MSFTVQWSATALDSLLDILDFIAEENPAAAARTVDDLLERVEVLVEYPRLGVAFSEESGPDLRRLILDKYIVVYQVLETRQTISVTAVRHSRQRPLTLEDLMDRLI